MTDRIETLLKECKRQLMYLTTGEECDHSVGVCYCDIYKLLGEIDAILGGITEEDIQEMNADMREDVLRERDEDNRRRP